MARSLASGGFPRGRGSRSLLAREMAMLTSATAPPTTSRSSWAGYRATMGTSFTEYRGGGFWTRDAALETVLALLVVELEPLAREEPDLEPALDRWTVQSVAGFIGCVSAGLDEELTERPGLGDLVIAALLRIRGRLPSAGDVEVNSPVLARRAEEVCAGQHWSTPGASATWAGNVADALRDLVAGRLPDDAGSFWWVDGDGRHLLPKQRPEEGPEAART